MAVYSSLLTTPAIWFILVNIIIIIIIIIIIANIHIMHVYIHKGVKVIWVYSINQISDVYSVKNLRIIWQELTCMGTSPL